MVHFDFWLGQVEGFYISEISIKMRLASHTHGFFIPWNILNFILNISNFVVKSQSLELTMDRKISWEVGGMPGVHLYCSTVI